MRFRGHFLLAGIFIFTLYLFLLFAAQNIPKLKFESGIYPLPIFSIPMIVIAVFVALYGSILPDIDTLKSKVFLGTNLVLVTLCCYALLIGEKMLSTLSFFLILLIIALVILGHRKLTHKPLMALLYALLITIIFFDFYVGLFAFVGYGSHLVGDKITGKK